MTTAPTPDCANERGFGESHSPIVLMDGEPLGTANDVDVKCETCGKAFHLVGGELTPLEAQPKPAPKKRAPRKTTRKGSNGN